MAETVIRNMEPSDTFTYLANEDAFSFELFREAAMIAPYDVHYTITLPRSWFLRLHFSISRMRLVSPP